MFVKIHTPIVFLGKWGLAKVMHKPHPLQSVYADFVKKSMSGSESSVFPCICLFTRNYLLSKPFLQRELCLGMKNNPVFTKKKVCLLKVVLWRKGEQEIQLFTFGYIVLQIVPFPHPPRDLATDPILLLSCLVWSQKFMLECYRTWGKSMFSFWNSDVF